MDIGVLTENFAAKAARSARLEAAQNDVRKLDAAIARAERESASASREEEAVEASYARRQQSLAEAKDTLIRMERKPGVSFLGMASPARQCLRQMREAVKSHTRAVSIAKERRDFAVKVAKQARGRLASLRAERNRLLERTVGNHDARQLDDQLERAQSNLRSVVRFFNESTIDQAVMMNRMTADEAAKARAQLRNERTPDLER